ncbi:unnamed protein product [Polarella glacialis]|uniref:Uncharacterized protein n=1 Tax=Polarella glacialis TaxID=89957 RepID=A0A813FFJ1_POLGL|nr:unnamed protein product [Polarella glacialis]
MLCSGPSIDQTGAECRSRVEQCCSKTTWPEKARFQDENESWHSRFSGNSSLHSLTMDFDPVAFPLSKDENADQVLELFNSSAEFLACLESRSWRAVIRDYEYHDLTEGQWEPDAQLRSQRRRDSRSRAEAVLWEVRKAYQFVHDSCVQKFSRFKRSRFEQTVREDWSSLNSRTSTPRHESSLCIRMVADARWPGDTPEDSVCDNSLEFGHSDFEALQKLRGLPFQGLRRQAPSGHNEENCQACDFFRQRCMQSHVQIHRVAGHQQHFYELTVFAVGALGSRGPSAAQALAWERARSTLAELGVNDYLKIRAVAGGAASHGRDFGMRVLIKFATEESAIRARYELTQHSHGMQEFWQSMQYSVDLLHSLVLKLRWRTGRGCPVPQPRDWEALIAPVFFDSYSDPEEKEPASIAARGRCSWCVAFLLLESPRLDRATLVLISPLPWLDAAWHKLWEMRWGPVLEDIRVVEFRNRQQYLRLTSPFELLRKFPTVSSEPMQSLVHSGSGPNTLLNWLLGDFQGGEGMLTAEPLSERPAQFDRWFGIPDPDELLRHLRRFAPDPLGPEGDVAARGWSPSRITRPEGLLSPESAELWRVQLRIWARDRELLEAGTRELRVQTRRVCREIRHVTGTLQNPDDGRIDAVRHECVSQAVEIKDAFNHSTVQQLRAANLQTAATVEDPLWLALDLFSLQIRSLLSRPAHVEQALAQREAQSARADGRQLFGGPGCQAWALRQLLGAYNDLATALRATGTPRFMRLPVDQLHFTQQFISSFFRQRHPDDVDSDTGAAYLVECTIEELRSGAVDPETLGPLRVVRYNGLLWCLDNRRLYCLKEAGVTHINVQFLPLVDGSDTLTQFFNRLTTQSEGRTVEIRARVAPHQRWRARAAVRIRALRLALNILATELENHRLTDDQARERATMELRSLAGHEIWWQLRGEFDHLEEHDRQRVQGLLDALWQKLRQCLNDVWHFGEQRLQERTEELNAQELVRSLQQAVRPPLLRQR